MKKLLLTLGIIVMFLVTSNISLAGDCKTRDTVDWHATISSGVYVRSDCPTGDIVGTVPGGEVVRILEVDKYSEFYLIETSVGTGFVFSSFLKDITKSPLNGTTNFEESIFKDLDPNHKYYDEIKHVKELGIVSGTPEGEIKADEPVNRAELAKIIVESDTDDEVISAAALPPGTYSDIIEGEWYVPYLQIAREKEFMVGDSDATTVRPGEGANGAEVAKMIVIGIGLDPELIPELQPGQLWYQPFMDALKNLGALPYSKPTHKVTRGEMMYIISKLLSG